MLLAIDIGNTDSVFGIYNQDTLITRWRLSTGQTRTVDESWITIKLLCQEGGVDPGELHNVIIGSVVPNVTHVFSTMTKKYLDMTPIIVDATLPIDINIKYENPRQVGADRICNAVAGKRLYRLPQAILDFGTATTFDVLDHTGAYLGGVIMPGIEIAAKDLFEKAARLFKVELEFPERIIGRTTEQSLQSGIMYGAVDAINGILVRIRNELDASRMDIIVTGGMGELIKPYIQNITDLNGNLTLEGLRFIFEEVGG